MITRVTTKGQVTIPADIRQAARIEPGAELDWSYDTIGHQLIATKVSRDASHAGDRTGDRSIEERIASVRGIVKTSMTTDQIMALLRGDDDL